MHQHVLELSPRDRRVHLGRPPVDTRSRVAPGSTGTPTGCPPSGSCDGETRSPSGGSARSCRSTQSSRSTGSSLPSTSSFRQVDRLRHEPVTAAPRGRARFRPASARGVRSSRPIPDLLGSWIQLECTVLLGQCRVVQASRRRRSLARIVASIAAHAHGAGSNATDLGARVDRLEEQDRHADVAAAVQDHPGAQCHTKNQYSRSANTSRYR